MAGTVPAFPLAWPPGWARATYRREAPFSHGGFKVSWDKAIELLEAELERLGAINVTLSSNVEMSIRGRPLSTTPADAGVAVYFKLAGRDTVLACDKWDRVADNLRAIAKHIEALRGQDRWGVGNTLQAFAGYVALPPPENWWDVLEIPRVSTKIQINDAFRRLARVAHPDNGGTTTAMARLNAARDAGFAERDSEAPAVASLT